MLNITETMDYDEIMEKAEIKRRNAEAGDTSLRPIENQLTREPLTKDQRMRQIGYQEGGLPKDDEILARAKY